MEIDYQPRLGILVPQQNGQRITVAYDGVPAGTLVGYVGLHDYYARKNGDGLVTLRVRADETQSIVVPIRNPTLRRRRLAALRAAAPRWARTPYASR